MKWDWLWGKGLWTESDPNRKPEFHTIREDIQELGRLAVKGLVIAIGTVLYGVVLWPFAAAGFWVVGRGDDVLDGVMAVGYVWVVMAIAIAWPLSWLVAALQPVPVWAWLMIIPLFGIWWQLRRRGD